MAPLTDQGTAAQRGRGTCQGYTASQCQSPNQNPDSWPQASCPRGANGHPPLKSLLLRVPVLAWPQ